MAKEKRIRDTGELAQALNKRCNVSIMCLHAKSGVDKAEKEPSKAWALLAVFVNLISSQNFDWIPWIGAQKADANIG